MKSSLHEAKDKALDSQLALSLIGRDAPHDLIVNRDFVTRIGNLCDVAFVRKLNISFNRIRSLDGIDQLPQLKFLLAYACDIDKIECLKAISKIESILLQQNRISKMLDTFSGMSKLQELRLDQNRISKIEHLSGCVSLKKLDLSFNNIDVLNGISGLQQLQELKVSNNQIKSLLPLKALPSIRELDVSNNQLKSLDGLQQLPTLEFLRADHNMIAELKILPMMGSNKRLAVDASSKTNSTPSANKKATTSAGKKNEVSEIANLSGPMLQELSVNGNRIRSVHGLEIYKDCLEMLDLSSNNFPATEAANLVLALKPCTKLTELRMHLNPICDDEAAMDDLVIELSEACPSLRAIDGLAIVANSDFSFSGKSSRVPAGAYSSAMSQQNVSTALINGGGDIGGQFHTWNDEGTTVDGGASVGDTLKDEETEKGDLSDDSDAESNAAEKENNQSADNPEVKRYPPNLQLKEMLTPEQIQEQEDKIRSGLQYCKDKLEAATRTVFGFVDEPAEPVREFKPRRLLPTTAPSSESGKRVAAVLDAADTVSRKNSAVVVTDKSTPASTAAAPDAVGNVQERVAMKEKLVDRVRLAVSSSASTLDISDKHNINVLDTEKNRPSTSASASVEVVKESAAGISIPNNPLLTDEMAASFKQHREANEKEASSYATSPARSPVAGAAAALSPGSEAGSKTVYSSQSKTTRSSSTVGPSSNYIPGSGLTRYGTKIKSRNSASSGASFEDPTLQTNVSILRATGDAVDSISLLNLRITKPSQHVYMTEWRGDGETSAGAGIRATIEDEEIGEMEEEGEYMYDQDIDEHATALDAVIEGEEEEEGSPVKREILFHEVKTRPEDRFGRAMAPVGGAGYDVRGIRRGTDSSLKASDDLVREIEGSGDRDRAPLRRGHSAPSLDSPSPTPFRIEVSEQQASETPPLSPAVSVGLSSASIVSLPSYQPRLHPAAATVISTGLGSISPRPMVPSNSQPKLKFSIPQSARAGLTGGSTLSTSNIAPTTATSTSTSTIDKEGAVGWGKRARREEGKEVDFETLEREILRATGMGSKNSRNPTLPLPVAPSGPFSPSRVVDGGK